jgi:hypothetical protein
MKGLGAPPPRMRLLLPPARAACASGTAARSRRELPQRGPITQGPWSAPRARIETTNQPEAGKGLRKACWRSGALGPVTEHHHAGKYRLPPGFKPHAARRHWQHAASNDARARIRDNRSW